MSRPARDPTENHNIICFAVRLGVPRMANFPSMRLKEAFSMFRHTILGRRLLH